MKIRIKFYDKKDNLKSEEMEISKAGKNRRMEIATSIGRRKYGEKFHSAEIVEE